MTVQILHGDCRDVLATLPAESVHCVVTSPPYWGLRDYGVAGQLGLERSLGDHVETMVAAFREVRRVLRKDGTLWLNYGDSYAANPNGRSAADVKALGNDDRTFRDKPFSTIGPIRAGNPDKNGGVSNRDGLASFDCGVLKPKDLCGIPWRVAFALQADGWWLRQDIIWSKPNPMPESITDRCTKAHEYLFLLSKSARYYFDAAAIAENAVRAGDIPGGTLGFLGDGANDGRLRKGLRSNGSVPVAAIRNKRSVWEVATQPFSEAHFATFPPALIEPCILAGTSANGCCATCGAPWVREIERQQTGRTQKMADGWDTGKGGHDTIHRKGREPGETGKPVMAAVTIGWSPSCACDAAVVPCTVLDPFSGAGTTGLVADRLQRSAIMIELNPAYVAMACKRIVQDAPLFAKVATNEPRPIAHAQGVAGSKR
jgi:DNA modification methylase